MAKTSSVNLCIIGAGSGGLALAAGAVQMGARVALIEKGKMGGDCLNYGCVPSKAMIAAGKHAHGMSSGEAFGVARQPAEVDFSQVAAHVRGVINAIAPHDSQERFEGLGVEVYRTEGKFLSGHVVEAGEHRIQAQRFVIATGSSPGVPPIPGLDGVPFFTNETIFDNKQRPEHLIVIGGGPIGMELAQAHRRLGSNVTVLEMFQTLAKDDSELTQIVKDSMITDGVTLLEGIAIDNISKSEGGGVCVRLRKDEREQEIHGSHLLVAAGRRPNVSNLELEKAGVAYSPRGIEVDARLRTTNKKIFAIGDVTGGLQFTHVAGYHAGIVIRNALLRIPAKADHSCVPWVTYTDPELAHVGLDETHARGMHGDKLRVLRWSMEENDRAQAERRTKGMAKALVSPRGRILGVSIVGPHAGDLLQPWVLAMTKKLKIGSMAGFIAPYPTLGEVNKRIAGSYFTEKLFSNSMRRIVRFLSAFG